MPQARRFVGFVLVAAGVVGVAALVFFLFIYPRLDFHSYTPDAGDVQRWAPMVHNGDWQYSGIYANRQVNSWLFRVERDDTQSSPTLGSVLSERLQDAGWTRRDRETWYQFTNPRQLEMIRIAPIGEDAALMAFVQAKGVRSSDYGQLQSSDPQLLWAAKFFWPKYYSARTFYGVK